MTRKEILNEYYKVYDQREAYFVEAADKDTEIEADEYNHQLDMLEKEYLKTLAQVNLSRCPFTGEILNLAIDTAGLDGLWWRNDMPVRKSGKAPATFLCYDGAMQLNDSLEDTPFLCMPGPDLPFVIPDLLAREDVLAVVSTVKIGAHKGYAVVYYATNPAEHPDRTNDWGGSSFVYEDEEGNERTLASPYNFLDYDYNLLPWIQTGKLLWIGEGDATLTLKSDIQTCPYLELSGSGTIQLIIYGEAEALECEFGEEEPE